MGFLNKLVDTVKTQVEAAKDEKEAMELFIRENKGTEAITAFYVALFNIDQPAYNLLKANKHMDLWPVVFEDHIDLCIITPDGEGEWKKGGFGYTKVRRDSFETIYEWYGLNSGEGYAILPDKRERKYLETLISSAVSEMKHINLTYGLSVKRFF